jgi:hypothetical protein
MAKRKYLQGRYSPINPAKYNGNPRDIVFRSSWELKFFRYCDLNSSVLKWSSETTIVPYRNPFTGEFHRYFVDVSMHYKDANGVVKKILVEIKPRKETMEPVVPKRKTKKYLQEVEKYVINKSKWEAAEAYAAKRGMQFMILTEKNLGINK